MSEPYSIETARAGIHRKGTAARLGWSSLAAFAVMCPITMALDAWAHGLASSFGIGATFLLPLLLGLASLVALVPLRRAGRVTFDDDSVLLPGGRRVPRSRVRGGWVVPSRRGPRVELQVGGGDALVIAVADLAEGERVLAAAGVAASQRRLEVRSGTVLDTAMVLIYGTLFGAVCGVAADAALGGLFAALPGWLGSLVIAAVAVATPLAMLVLRAATRVVVGADGLTLYNGLLRRFVPYASIRSIGASPPPRNALRFELTEGRKADLSLSGLTLEERAALEARIQAARAEASRRDAGPPLELLDRNARPLSAWRDALRELGALVGGYRAQSITREDLLRVLDDASAAAERRIGAALALAARRDDAAALARVRVAAQTCASEPLRVALTATAEGALDDTSLDRALDASERAAVRVRGYAGGAMGSVKRKLAP